jgi:TfoX/Sxy family transcriptional regulator of competence genes
VAYDEALAERVRAALGVVADVAEIKMFGGLCFTIRGSMALGVSHDDLMVRLSPDEGDAAMSESGARPMDFTGRPMRGYLFVAQDAIATERSLQRWVDRGVAHASSLPPKSPKAKKPRSSKQAVRRII